MPTRKAGFISPQSLSHTNAPAADCLLFFSG
jgi:hypothetical protein